MRLFVQQLLCEELSDIPRAYQELTEKLFPGIEVLIILKAEFQ